MPTNASYGWNTVEDGAPATSRLTKSWGSNFAIPEYVLEVRTYAKGAGSIRLGELKIVGFASGGIMSASIAPGHAVDL